MNSYIILVFNLIAISNLSVSNDQFQQLAAEIENKDAQGYVEPRSMFLPLFSYPTLQEKIDAINQMEGRYFSDSQLAEFRRLLESDTGEVTFRACYSISLIYQRRFGIQTNERRLLRKRLKKLANMDDSKVLTAVQWLAGERWPADDSEVLDADEYYLREQASWALASLPKMEDSAFKNKRQ